MKVTMRDLQAYDWNGILLFGDKNDSSTWYWAERKSHVGDECLATALEITKASTPYESLAWEMETEEGDEGYEEECEAREELADEEYEVVLPED
jgi:hypothetical protein